MATDTIGELKIKLTFDTSSFEASQKEVENSAKGTYSVAKQTMGNLMSDVIKSTANEVKQLAKNVAEVGSSFDSAMSKVAAVSGATSVELAELRKKARQMGETTIFSATESAEAFNYMAMAGWSASEMMDGIEGVMNLAAAAGTDLATTSDIVTDALTAMGYSAKDAGKFADVMAAASANANTNVEMMGETFKYAASVAGSLGYNIEDTATAIGLMANAGIKSTQAGTSLRSILSRLAAPTSDVQKAMDELGVSLKDDQGNMKSLDAVMVDLRKGFSKLSATQKTEMASTIAGKNAMSGLLAIVNASEADYKKLTTAVNNSTGAAKKMADEMNNNVSGKMKLLKSQLEDIAITIWDRVSPTIMNALDKVSEALKRVNWDAVADKIGEVFSAIMDRAIWIIEHADLVINVIKAVAVAIAAIKVNDFIHSIMSIKDTVMAAIPMVESFGASLVALATNPVTLVVAGIAGVAAAMVGITVAIKESEGGISASIRNMNKVIAESQSYLKSSQKEWEALKEKQTEAVKSGVAELNYYSQLADELDLIVDKNGKVKSGYEDRAQFITTKLSAALGTEIKYIDGIIEGYDGIRDGIRKTIEAKKAELILASQEEIYKKAIEERMTLTKQMAQLTREQQLAAEQGRDEDRLKIEKHLEQLRGQYEQYTLTIGQYENNMALYSSGKYDEMTQTIHEYSDQYANAEEAVKATLLDEVLVTTNDLGALKSLYEQTGLEIFQQKQATAQASLESHEDEMKQYFGTTEEYLVETSKAWNHNLDLQLSEITGRNVQFVEAGEGLVNMMVDGVVAKEGLSKESMRDLINATITEINMKKQDALASGTNLINGVNEGLKNAGAQAEVFNTTRNFSNGVLGVIHESWEEHSPSKAAERSGINLLYGVRNGITNGDAQGGVFGAISSFASGIVYRFQSALGIHSPSRIMRDVVGKNIAAGIGVGFEDEIDDVQKDMQSEVKQLAAGIYAEVPTFDYTTSVTSSSLFDGMLAEERASSGNAASTSEPIVVNLVLDGQQIQQVMLQDIRRTI